MIQCQCMQFCGVHSPGCPVLEEQIVGTPPYLAGKINPAWQPVPAAMNPWHPMTDPVDLKTAGKVLEELGECTAALSRCLIQGMDDTEPTTGKVNREWLEDEIADVYANFELLIERFDLKISNERIARKSAQLRSWHKMA